MLDPRNAISSTLRSLGILAPRRIRAHTSVTPLGAREAYRHWASTYRTETATSCLDEELAQRMLGQLSRRRLLDAGCGVGRRIAAIPDAVGLDASPEMLAAGGARNVVAGDVRAMPFPSESFDMVWCRLVLGHLPDATNAYQELARVCCVGGHVFVTDFHSDAAAAGHRRSFTDQAGVVHEIEHYVHRDHIGIAQATGLSLVASDEGAVGTSVRRFYAQGIGLKAYRKDKGLKLVAAYLFRRMA
ncbi:class I SAM-dependent methyltransferase [Acidipila sp. EB88]|uniref:class I SAM-dependent methyltransferase n=1 Tax=Acidipila sp. EB88 TaxID=2305226 RepID=UPI000F5FC81E|nr:class I SAM-dependent methyltransferase [Acidipila sp. EB88]RRA49631.1 class I SAM-dependent methyltransferase [Acidipila sp. EB88]